MLDFSVVTFWSGRSMINCIVVSYGMVCERTSDVSAEGALAVSLVEDWDELYALHYN